MKTLIAVLVTTLFSFNALAADPPKAEPKKDAPKAEAKADAKKDDKKADAKVKKPCKEGQTEEKDNCHEVKKAEKAKK